MTRIGVVLPTIRGREDLFERAMEAYRLNTPKGYELKILTPRDADGIAEAWDVGALALRDKCDYLHLSADDILPHPTWAQAGVKAADEGVYPSPRLVHENGELESCGCLGGGMYLPEVEDGAPASHSAFPFMEYGFWESITPLPRIHYYCDDLIAYMARHQGLEARVVRDYCFTHLEGTVGRARHVANGMRDRAIVLEEIGKRLASRQTPPVSSGPVLTHAGRALPVRGRGVAA